MGLTHSNILTFSDYAHIRTRYWQEVRRRPGPLTRVERHVVNRIIQLSRIQEYRIHEYIQYTHTQAGPPYETSIYSILKYSHFWPDMLVTSGKYTHLTGTST